MYRLVRLLLLVGMVLSGRVTAQDQVTIDADNIGQLNSMQTIHFRDLPAAAGAVINGRFYVTNDGRRLAVVNRDSQVVLLSDRGEVLYVSDMMLTTDGFPATFIDGTFDDRGDVFASIHSASSEYFVTLITVEGHERSLVVQSDNKPVDIWLDGEQVWLELVSSEPGRPSSILKLPSLTEERGEIDEPALFQRFFDDENSVVRIGRLAPPLAITVTEDGLVQRWDLQSGALTGRVEVAEIPIYGYTTADGNRLLWRDPLSMALHLLDFESDTDKVVVALHGIYIPFIFLSAQADVAIGVYVADKPVIAAWDMATGERYDLGLFHQCQRPPDMVRLSQDGTTLVVGCDTGLDIWRVQDAINLDRQ